MIIQNIHSEVHGTCSHFSLRYVINTVKYRFDKSTKIDTCRAVEKFKVGVS